MSLVDVTRNAGRGDPGSAESVPADGPSRQAAEAGGAGLRACSAETAKLPRASLRPMLRRLADPDPALVARDAQSAIQGDVGAHPRGSPRRGGPADGSDGQRGIKIMHAQRL